MIRNIILDVGRVLVAWRPKQLWEQFGYSKETIEVLGQQLFDSGLWNEADRGVLLGNEFLEFAIKQVPDYEPEIRKFWENIDQAIEQFDYTREWIGSMKKAGYRVYILSNYGDWTYEKTRESALNFLEDVDGAIFSYQVKQIKPNPEIYHTLLEKYSLLPEECVFLDDLPANVEAARKVGIHAIVFKNQEEAMEELKTYGVEF